MRPDIAAHLLMAVMLLLPVTSWSEGRPDRACAGLWRSAGPLLEKAHGVLQTYQIPDEGFIDGFIVKSLYREDGSKFLPESIRESNCYLDRILAPEVRAALIRGAQTAISRNRGAHPDTLLDAMYHATASRLDELFHDTADGGILGFFSYVEFEYGIGEFPFLRRDPNPLIRDAFSHGAYTEREMIHLLWLSYLRHLGVQGLTPLLEYLRSLDAPLAPPARLDPPGCKAGILYKWPTVSDPIKTFQEVGADVHWGVCSSTAKLWVYSHRRGWKQVKDDGEVAKFCVDVDWTEEPIFSELCSRYRQR
jgi:hypothetical protein